VLSVAVGPLRGKPVLLRNADAPHEAASTMKVAVLAALYRAGVPLDEHIPVVNRFGSAVGGWFGIDPAEDGDPEPWRLLDGGRAQLRWLAERMVMHSSNLATNLCVARLPPGAADAVWRSAGATGSRTPRGVEDLAAREAGIRNVTTAHDLLRLLRSLEPELLALLERNVWRVDLAAGLPPGTRVAFKNGWIRGARHSAGVIYPRDTAPYVLATCYSGPLATGSDEADPAARLLARVSAGVWRRRREISGGPGGC
jgi:beta-lactamase class A